METLITSIYKKVILALFVTGAVFVIAPLMISTADTFIALGGIVLITVFYLPFMYYLFKNDVKKLIPKEEIVGEEVIHAAKQSDPPKSKKKPEPPKSQRMGP